MLAGLPGLILGLTFGCTRADVDVPMVDVIDAAPAEITPLGFALDGTGRVTASWRAADGWASTEAAIEVAEASADIRTGSDGAVSIDDLRMRFAGVPLGDGVGALELADVELTLVRPVELEGAVWDGVGLLAAAEGQIDLDLHWALAAGDDQLPLAPQTITGVALRVGLRRRGERWTTTLVLTRDGPAWSWGELIELSDLRIDVHGAGE